MGGFYHRDNLDGHVPDEGSAAAPHRCALSPGRSFTGRSREGEQNQERGNPADDRRDRGEANATAPEFGAQAATWRRPQPSVPTRAPGRTPTPAGSPAPYTRPTSQRPC